MFEVNLACLALDQCNLCRVLNCVTVCFKQIEEECMLSNVDCHMSSESSLFTSSHLFLKQVKGFKLEELSNVYIFVILLFRGGAKI